MPPAEKNIDTCHDLTRRVIEAALTTRKAAEDNDLDGLNYGIYLFADAVRDIASLGELRQIEDEMNQLIAGMVSKAKRGSKRPTQAGRRIRP